MNCWAALSAPPWRNQGSLHQSCPDHFEVVPSLGLYQLRGYFRKSCCGHCLSVSLELHARKNKNPCGEDKTHLCLHYLLGEKCFIFIALELCSTTGPNSGGMVNSPVLQANKQRWMAVAVRAMTVGLILSINDLSFIPICCMPEKYVRRIRSTISVTTNWNLHS